MWHYPASRATLLRERDDALSDTRLAARFKSFRVNLPAKDENTTLLTVDDWRLVLNRPVPPREGQPLVSLRPRQESQFFKRSGDIQVWQDRSNRRGSWHTDNQCTGGQR